ncbi:septal ring lytic transglycosylase RlpA family protein [bacterium]|nr:MAG: septal ring lytic transglycosylase RlpA family protein [bacterium]
MIILSKSNSVLIILTSVILISGCVPQPIYKSISTPVITRSGEVSEKITESFTGTASYYADKFHGRKTASGETFNMHDLTAAHKTLPFGTIVKVTNLKNDKSVKLKINDRGPFVKDRIIDVSLAAAKELDMLGTGTAEVRVDIVGTEK